MARKSDRQRCFVKARHNFTIEEWQATTRELTRSMELVDEQEAADKAAAASRKASLKELRSKVNELRNKVASGGEDRDVEATVEFMPKKGFKVYRHHCPGKPEHETEIRREPMTQVDYEGQLPLGDEPAPAKPEDKNDKADGAKGDSPAA